MIAPVHPDDKHSTRAAEFEPGDRTEERSAGETGPHPLDPLLFHLANLRRQIGEFLAIQGDRAKLKVRRTLLHALLGCLAGIVGLTVLIAAAVVFVLGVSDGLAVLLGNVWAGELATGGGLLILCALAIWAGARSLIRASLRRTIEKYECRRKKEHNHMAREAGPTFHRNSPVHPH